MLSLLVAVRNFTIAVLLAWMGFSVSPDSEDKKEANSAAPANAISSVLGR
ncbi:MAG: hypothetical protein HRT80_15430 [Henriciella sp.]|nr:hypothetical protein [Henriciella sp.]